jgi:hypothetical protein
MPRSPNAYGHDVVRHHTGGSSIRCVNTPYHRAQRDEVPPLATHTVSWCQGSRWRSASQRLTRQYCSACAQAFARKHGLTMTTASVGWDE